MWINSDHSSLEKLMNVHLRSVIGRFIALTTLRFLYTVLLRFKLT